MRSVVVPVLVTIASFFGALLLGTADAHAHEPSRPYPPPPPPPLPGTKVAPVPVPPSNAQAYTAQVRAAGFVMAAPTENSDVVTDLPTGSSVLLPNVNDLRPATPGGPGGWVATGDSAGGVGLPYGWVSLSNLVLTGPV